MYGWVMTKPIFPHHDFPLRRIARIKTNPVTGRMNHFVSISIWDGFSAIAMNTTSTVMAQTTLGFFKLKSTAVAEGSLMESMAICP